MSTVLTAVNSKELLSAQAKLAGFLEHKLNDIKAHELEVSNAVEQAIKNKWDVKTLRAALARTKRQRIYYEKIKSATEAGYQIIPSFWNAEWFAIRTDKAKPKKQVSTSQNKITVPSRSPSGEGRYVDERVFTKYHDSIPGKNHRNEDITHDRYIADSFDGIELPIELVKPQLLSATKQAMNHLIFDRIGISKSNADPFIVGQIEGDNYKEIYFLIAWYLDLKSI